jgi:hypothetical protein
MHMALMAVCVLGWDLAGETGIHELLHDAGLLCLLAPALRLRLVLTACLDCKAAHPTFNLEHALRDSDVCGGCGTGLCCVRPLAALQAALRAPLQGCLPPGLLLKGRHSRMSCPVASAPARQCGTP